MTVQEAKCQQCNKKCPQEKLASDIAKGRMYATNEFIQCQKELEQYRALGTPKEIKIREVSSAQLGKAYLSNLTELREYQSLGTVEELKEAREFKKYFDELYGEGLEVANWHKNGNLEPFDSFYESALEFEGSKEDD